MIQRLQQLIALPQAEEEERLLTQILYIVLLASIGASALTILVFGLLGSVYVTRTVFMGLLALLAAFVLARRGLTLFASLLVAYSMPVMILYFLNAGAGIHDEGIIIYPVTILVGSLLLSRRQYLLFVGLALAAAGWLVFVDATGTSAPAGAYARRNLLISVSLMILITAVIVRIVTESLQAGILQARHNEQKLHKSSEMLSMINTISNELHRTLDLQRVAERAVTLIIKHLQVPLVGVYTLDEARQQLLLVAAQGSEDLVRAGNSLPVHDSLTGTAVLTKRTVTCHDLLRDHRVVPAIQKALAAQGFLGGVFVPILVQERVIGTINVLFLAGQPIPADIEATLTPLAQSLGLAINNAQVMNERRQAESQLRQLAQRAQALSETSRLLAEVTHDYGGVLDTVVRRVAELIGDSCGISLISDDGPWLKMEAVYHPNPDIRHALRETLATIPHHLDEGHAGRVIQTGRPLLLPESDMDSIRSTFKPEYRYLLDRFPMYSRVMAPLQAQGTVIGTIGLSRFEPGKSYTEDDVAFLQDLADRAALAIANARLYRSAQQELADRKRAEARQAELIQELETKNTELEYFAYTVSHDLKSPLITIRGFLRFIERDVLAGNTERVRADMGRIHEAADKMGQLMDELLLLSRAGRLQNEPEAVSFRTLAEEAVRLAGGRVAERGVQVEIAPVLPVVLVDRPRIVDALQNLISNAAKFMGDQPQPRIQIGVERREEELAFFVRDNGVGIAPADQARVFNLFERLDTSTEGTGIGLALVQRIIAVHNGRIWVESAGAQTGSTFYFTLPAAPKLEPEQEA